MRRAAAASMLLLAAACARPPTALRGSFAPLGVEQARAGAPAGTRVRWGGEIVSTTPGRNETCLEVVSKPLDRQAHPERADETEGRFIACAPGFYDPAIYAARREVTVVGTLQAPVRRRIGEYDYTFPAVQADTIYLWRPPEPRGSYYDPWLEPYWGWGPFWGWGAGGLVAVPVPHRTH